MNKQFLLAVSFLGLHASAQGSELPFTSKITLRRVYSDHLKRMEQPPLNEETTWDQLVKLLCIRAQQTYQAPVSFEYWDKETFKAGTEDLSKQLKDIPEAFVLLENEEVLKEFYVVEKGIYALRTLESKN